MDAVDERINRLRERNRAEGESPLAKLRAELEEQQKVEQAAASNTPWYTDMALGVARGPLKAISAASNSFSLGRWDEGRINLFNGRPFIEVPEQPTLTTLITGPKKLPPTSIQSGIESLGNRVTVAGNLTEGLAQFATGFVATKRLTAALGIMQKVGPAASFARETLVNSPLTIGLFFDGQEKNVANLAQDLGVQNEVVEYLANNESTPELRGRLNNMVADALTGVAIGAAFKGGTMAVKGELSSSFMDALDSIKAWRQGKPIPEVQPPPVPTARPVPDVSLAGDLKLAPDVGRAVPTVGPEKPSVGPAKPSPAGPDTGKAGDLSATGAARQEPLAIDETPIPNAPALSADELAAEAAKRSGDLRLVTDGSPANGAPKTFPGQANALAGDLQVAPFSDPTIGPPKPLVEAQAAVEGLEGAARTATDRASKLDASLPKPATTDELLQRVRTDLGITDEKLAEVNGMFQRGEIKPEDISSVLGFNPERMGLLQIPDHETIIGYINAVARVFEQSGLAAGAARVSVEETAKLAQRYGGSIEDAVETWLKTRDLPQHILALRVTAESSATLVDTYAQRILAGTFKPRDLIDFLQAQQLSTVVQAVHRGTRASIGRSLNIFKASVQVAEASVKMGKGRLMREARKLSDAAAKRKALTEQATVAHESKVAARTRLDDAVEVLKDYDKAIVTAEKFLAKAKIKGDRARELDALSVEKAVAEQEAAQKALDAAKQAAADAKVKAAADARMGQAKDVLVDFNNKITAAEKFLENAKLAGDRARARDALAKAQKAAAAQRAAIKEAEKVSKAAEREAKRYEDAVARANKGETGDYNLGGGAPTKLAKVDISADATMAEVEEALKQMGLSTGKVIDLARLAAKAADRVEQMRIGREVGMWGKVSDAVTNVYLNSILSGIPTLLLNVAQFLKVAETVIESYGSAALSLARGGDKFDWIVANKSTIALSQSIPDAWRAAGQAWKEGLPQTDVLARAEVAARAVGNSNVIQQYLSLPSRAMVTIDEFYKVMFYRQELMARSVEVAAAAARLNPNKALQDKVFTKTLQELIDAPPDDLKYEAILMARENTFQSDLTSRIGQLATDFANLPFARLFVPFVKTPANIMRQAILERTPLAALRSKVRDEIAQGGRTGNSALLRLGLASGFMFHVAYLHSQGKITGGRYSTKANQNTGDLSGVQPYSYVSEDGTAVQLNRLDPYSTTMMITIDIMDAMKEWSDANEDLDPSNDVQWHEVLGNSLALISESLLDKTWFQGMSDIMAVLGGTKKADEFLNDRLVAIANPVSGFTKNFNSQFDDYQHEAVTFQEKFFATIPGLSSQNPIKYDILGRPVAAAEKLGPNFASFIGTGKVDEDPLVKEMARLQFNYSRPDRDIQGVRLSTEQYSQLKQIWGETARGALQEAFDQEDYASLNDFQRTELMKRIISRAGTAAKTSVIGSNDTLREELMRRSQFKSDALDGLINP